MLEVILSDPVSFVLVKIGSSPKELSGLRVNALQNWKNSLAVTKQGSGMFISVGFMARMIYSHG